MHSEESLNPLGRRDRRSGTFFSFFLHPRVCPTAHAEKIWRDDRPDVPRGRVQGIGVKLFHQGMMSSL